MSDDQTYDFLNSGGQTAVSAPPDPAQNFLESGGDLRHASVDMGAADPITQYIHSAFSSAAQNVGATGHVLYDWGSGKIHSIAQADQSAQQYKADNPAYQPETQGGKAVASAMASPYNPLNWPGKAAEVAGKGVTSGLDALGVPSQVSTVAGPALEAGANVAAGAYGAVKGLGLGGAQEAAAAPAGARVEPTLEPEPLSASGSPRAAPFEPQDIPGTKLTVDNEPVQGGLPPEVSPQRAAILQRVGLDTARTSALAGDAKQAATDFQLSKFDEPAGVAARGQFDAEKQAMQAHASSIVSDTGGTLGTDEDSLNSRGQTIAAPFDALRSYFEKQKQGAYDAADARAEGNPVGKMEGTQALLKDPDFTETLLAKDQGGLLGSIQRQFGRFQDLNPDGFTVANAENFRKWLNQVWTPDNSRTLGQVKGALDDDVLKGAGEDIYGPARATVQMEKQTLDNPSGVSKLMDVDPKSPLNRTTPYNKIPDTLTRLAPDQFTNVIKTLQSMPDEIQPQAQAALGEIKAHLANKLLDAGSSTQGQWNAPSVSKVLKANSAKFQSAFEDDPASLAKIRDLDSAGRILKVDQSYPGAAAQAANALKRGFMSQALSKGASATGALAGSVLGPVGSAAGAAAGEALGGRIGHGLAEKAALTQWKRGTVPLSSLMQRGGTSPP
jgi:hypothetical protein